MLSVKGRSFAVYGWSSDYGLDILLRLFRQAGSLSDSNYWASVSSRKEVQEKLIRLNRLRGFDCTYEFAVHLRNGRKVKSLLRFIRNFFAHGGFRICEYDGQRFYALENSSNCQLSGRAVLRKETLLEWERIVRGGAGSKICTRR